MSNITNIAKIGRVKVEWTKLIQTAVLGNMSHVCHMHSKNILRKTCNFTTDYSNIVKSKSLMKNIKYLSLYNTDSVIFDYLDTGDKIKYENNAAFISLPMGIDRIDIIRRIKLIKLYNENGDLINSKELDFSIHVMNGSTEFDLSIDSLDLPIFMAPYSKISLCIKGEKHPFYYYILYEAMCIQSSIYKNLIKTKYGKYDINCGIIQQVVSNN